MTESLPPLAPCSHHWTLTVHKPPEKHSHFRYHAPAGGNRRAWSIRLGFQGPRDSRMGLGVGPRRASGCARAEVQERCLTHAVPRGPQGVHVHCWPTSATLNIRIPTALLFLVNKLLKRVSWYGVASAGDENVPQSGAECGEKLRAATLRTLEQWRHEVCTARALPPQKTRAGEGRALLRKNKHGESQEAMLG